MPFCSPGSWEASEVELEVAGVAELVEVEVGLLGLVGVEVSGLAEEVCLVLELLPFPPL